MKDESYAFTLDRLGRMTDEELEAEQAKAVRRVTELHAYVALVQAARDIRKLGSAMDR